MKNTKNKGLRYLSLLLIITAITNIPIADAQGNVSNVSEKTCLPSIHYIKTLAQELASRNQSNAIYTIKKIQKLSNECVSILLSFSPNKREELRSIIDSAIEIIRIPEAVLTAKANETTLIAEVIKAAKAIEVAEAALVTLADLTTEFYEATEAAEDAEAAEADLIAKATKAAEVTKAAKTAEAALIVKANEASEAVKAAEADLIAKTVEAAEATKAAKTVEAAEATKAAKTVEAAEAAEADLTAKTAEAAEAARIAKAFKASKAAEAAEAAKTTKTLGTLSSSTVSPKTGCNTESKEVSTLVDNLKCLRSYINSLLIDTGWDEEFVRRLYAGYEGISVDKLKGASSNRLGFFIYSQVDRSLSRRVANCYIINQFKCTKEDLSEINGIHVFGNIVSTEYVRKIQPSEADSASEADSGGSGNTGTTEQVAVEAVKSIDLDLNFYFPLKIIEQDTGLLAFGPIININFKKPDGTSARSEIFIKKLSLGLRAAHSPESYTDIYVGRVDEMDGWRMEIRGQIPITEVFNGKLILGIDINSGLSDQGNENDSVKFYAIWQIPFSIFSKPENNLL